MRIFKKPNTSNNWVCPICKKNDKKEVVLVGISGTQYGNIIEGEQVHLECISLTWDKERSIIFQFVTKPNTRRGE